MNPMRVIPGECLGEFALGASLNEILRYLRAHAGEFRRVNLEYTDSPCADIVVFLPWESIRLTFSSPSQKLRCVAVAALDHVNLCHDGVAFCGPCVTATFKKVYATFGPTQFGDLDQATGAYALRYDGLTVGFDVPLGALASVSETPTQQPFTLPDGKPLLAQRLTVSHAKPPAPPALCVVGEAGATRWTLHGTSTICKGDTPCDALFELGEPDEVVNSIGSKCYSFKYFSKGVEVVFDATLHVVMALVLHTGIVHRESQFQFEPCHFDIQLSDDVSVTSTTNVGAEDLEEFLAGAEAPMLLGQSCVYDLPSGVKIETFPNGRIYTLALLL